MVTQRRIAACINVQCTMARLECILINHDLPFLSSLLPNLEISFPATRHGANIILNG